MDLERHLKHSRERPFLVQTLCGISLWMALAGFSNALDGNHISGVHDDTDVNRSNCNLALQHDSAVSLRRVWLFATAQKIASADDAAKELSRRAG
jgi:hypothetical protein